MWYKVLLKHAGHGYKRYYDLIFAKTYLEAVQKAKALQMPKGFIYHSVEADF